jgi:5-deoxy-5-amino-3-dehydroquinate synthase
MAKYHFLTGVELADLPLAERVAECVRIKADLVVKDATEKGERALLNYGHTLAHALEIAGEHDLRHGEAVAVGLVFAAELARGLERIDDDRVADHRRVVEGYGLPTTVDGDLDPATLVELMRRDKKAYDGLTFVLDGPRGPEIVTEVEDRQVLAALERVRP